MIQSLNAQNLDISNAIPAQLLENANAVVRKNDVLITINDYDDVILETDRIVTVLNRIGVGDIKAIESYNSNRKIKVLKAVVYDAFGNEISKFSKNDFRDESMVPSGTLYSDNRIKRLNYTPRSFPYTVHYTSKIQLKSTAFIPQWLPIEYYYASTENSTYKIVNNTDIKVKFKESNLGDYFIKKLGHLNYSATHLKAIKAEAYSPEFSTYGPSVKVALTKFSMEGVDGANMEWSDFGAWMNDNLLHDVSQISDELKSEIKSVTKYATTDAEKARIVYNFMQDRSRYISVQVGIGGWKPIEASVVHDLAYGDCKGLSNYTKALLDEVGVKSNYAVIYGDLGIKNIDKNFSSTQGNHVVLLLPELDGEEDVWLECTSKTNPFGYIAGWTDDRDALVITENGGIIKHTTSYPTEENTQDINADIFIKTNGELNAQIELVTKGYQYSIRENIKDKSEKERKILYQNLWEGLNGLQVNSSSFTNDVNAIKFTENINVFTNKYVKKVGRILLFQPVLFNETSSILPAYENREYKMEIDRGYVDTDSYTITLEDGISVDALPEDVDLETKFGSYSLKMTEINNKINVTRFLKINNGTYSKNDYETYRVFLSEIAKYDTVKAALKLK